MELRGVTGMCKLPVRRILQNQTHHCPCEVRNYEMGRNYFLVRQNKEWRVDKSAEEITSSMCPIRVEIIKGKSNNYEAIIATCNNI